jgi:hypothetical protein
MQKKKYLNELKKELDNVDKLIEDLEDGNDEMHFDLQ